MCGLVLMHGSRHGRTPHSQIEKRGVGGELTDGSVRFARFFRAKEKKNPCKVRNFWRLFLEAVLTNDYYKHRVQSRDGTVVFMRYQY